MENKNQTSDKAKRDWLLPASIVIAALLIGGSLVWSAGKKAELARSDQFGEERDAEALAENVIPVSSEDHVLGNRDASVKMIVFTDLECPFCKSFHPEVKKALVAYPQDLAVVYRHFPLQFHEYAEKEAEASECVAELGGNTRFWEYIDRIFEVTESNGTGLSLSDRERLAVEVGVDKAKWNECVDSGKYEAKIADQTQNGIDAGGQGTPFSIIIGREGKKYPVPGAFPFEAEIAGQPSLKAFIESALVE